MKGMKGAPAVAMASWLVACAPAAPTPAPAAPIAIASIGTAPAPPPAPPAVAAEVPEYARPLLPESGATDADVAAAAKELTRRAQARETIEPGASDALWQGFAAFRPSKAKSINLVKALHDAVLAVKAPGYGPKAAALLAVPLRDPHDTAEIMDQVQFLQNTAAQVIGALEYAGGAKALVKVLLTPDKRDLQFSARGALARMPDASEPLLVAALRGGDPELDALASAYPSRGDVPRVADALARISRPAGRDAVLVALERATSDDHRTALALTLPSFPHDAPLVLAFKSAYAKLDPAASVAMFGGANARALLLGGAAGFFDPSLVPWILKEVVAAKGAPADEMMAQGWPSAVKLMTTTSAPSVGAAIGARGPSLEKELHKSAAAVLAQCKQDPACYVSALDTAPPKGGPIKAAWMAAVYGNAATRDALVKKLATVTDASLRFAMATAVLHLSPRGDAAAATSLDAIVAADVKAGRQGGLDELRAVAMQLRARALTRSTP